MRARLLILMRMVGSPYHRAQIRGCPGIRHRLALTIPPFLPPILTPAQLFNGIDTANAHGPGVGDFILALPGILGQTRLRSDGESRGPCSLVLTSWQPYLQADIGFVSCTWVVSPQSSDYSLQNLSIEEQIRHSGEKITNDVCQFHAAQEYPGSCLLNFWISSDFACDGAKSHS